MHRRHLRWLTVAALAFTGVFATFAPSATAAAVATEPLMACPMIYPTPEWCNPTTVEYRAANLQHIGWTYLNLNHCPAGSVCAAVYRQTTPAWSWTGSAWVGERLPQGWVYVYPYTGEWRWGWTERTGWVAITGGRFEIR